MNRRDARQLLGLSPAYTPAEVEAAYRARVRVAHPDRGGSAEQFRALTESRRILLTAPASQHVIVAHDSRLSRRLLDDSANADPNAVSYSNPPTATVKATPTRGRSGIGLKQFRSHQSSDRPAGWRRHRPRANSVNGSEADDQTSSHSRP